MLQMMLDVMPEGKLESRLKATRQGDGTSPTVSEPDAETTSDEPDSGFYLPGGRRERTQRAAYHIKGTNPMQKDIIVIVLEADSATIHGVQRQSELARWELATEIRQISAANAEAVMQVVETIGYLDEWKRLACPEKKIA